MNSIALISSKVAKVSTVFRYVDMHRHVYMFVQVYAMLRLGGCKLYNG